MFVLLVCLLPLPHCGKMVIALVMTFSEQLGNDYRIMPLNSPSGSTLQWGAGRGLLFLTVLVIVLKLIPTVSQRCTCYATTSGERSAFLFNVWMSCIGSVLKVQADVVDYNIYL